MCASTVVLSVAETSALSVRGNVFYVDRRAALTNVLFIYPVSE